MATFVRPSDIAVSKGFLLTLDDQMGFSQGLSAPATYDECARFADPSSRTFLNGLTRIPMTMILPGGTYWFGPGTVTAPSIASAGDTDTGIDWPAAGQIAITIDGTQVAYFSSTGLTVTGLTVTGTLTVADLVVTGTTTLSALTAGRMLYTGTGGLVSVDAGALYDDTNNALTIGVARIHSTGTRNAFYGQASANFTLTGADCTGIGHNTLVSLTSGNFNTAVGSEALDALQGGSSNTGVGYRALTSLTSGSTNTAVGVEAGRDTTTAAGVTAIGSSCLKQNDTGGSNTGVGESCLLSNVSGGDNTGVGREALKLSNSTANTAVGAYSLNALTSGQENVAVGANCLGSLTTGSRCTAIGTSAGNTLTVESDVVAIGYNALTNAAGINNTAMGSGAGDAVTSGTGNTSVGQDALGAASTGSDTVAVGRAAGLALTTGGTCTFVGATSDTSDGTVTNSSAFGYGATITASNQIVLGNASVTAVRMPYLTAGSVLFAGTAGAVAQDNANLFYDDSQNFLGIGINASLAAPLHISASHATTTPQIILNQASTGDTAIRWTQGTAHSYIAGIDNTTDSYVVSYAATGTAVLGTNDRFSIGTDGSFRINEFLNVGDAVQAVAADDFCSGSSSTNYIFWDDSLRTLTLTSQSAANSTLLTVISTAANTASHAIWRAQTSGATGGDPYVTYNIDGVREWSHGPDNSATNDPWCLNASGSIDYASAYFVAEATGDVFARYNFAIGTSTFPSAGGGKVLVFGDNAAQPTMGSNTAGFYGYDSGSGTVEAWCVDEAGNDTQLSPHDADGLWYFHSVNRGRKRRLKVHMERIVRYLIEKDLIPAGLYEESFE